MKSRTELIPRRHLVIERKSQIRLVLLVVLSVLLYTILLVAAIVAPSILAFSAHGLPLEERFRASREFLLLDQRVVPVVLGVMLLVGLHFIFVSHRIFGPLYRLKRIFTAWRAGIWPAAVQIRPQDFHRELFDSFNLTTEQLGADVRLARDALAIAAETARIAAQSGLPTETARRLGESELTCNQALERLSAYRL